MTTTAQTQPIIARADDVLELKDIQGLIGSGYGRMKAALYVLLRIGDGDGGPAQARRWLSDIVPQLTNCTDEPDHLCINFACTYAGLERLGLSNDTLDDFPRELIEGMATEHRKRLLGDIGPSDPTSWRFGGPNNPPIHFLLMLFARDEAALEMARADHKARWREAGLEEVFAVLADVPPNRDSQRREHFGFADGISQPAIHGLERANRAINRSPNVNTIAIGEIVLGYPNGYNQFPDSPAVNTSIGTELMRGFPVTARHSREQAKRGSQQLFDFGRNGSYLVFRQLQQDVRAFWHFIAHAAGATDANGQPDIEAAIRLASKMTGRWPNGAPLTLSPDADAPEMETANDFSYRDNDHEGMKCPFGSHIRRTNPRDDMPEMATAELSTRVVNLHRILRRGRRYGKPLSESFDIGEMIRLSLSVDNDEGDEDRGLIFACFNANISRQFEFIQNTWVNNPKFAGLYEDADPISGFHDPFGTGKENGVFTVPAEPVRSRYTGLFSWVVTKGGAYFFMPGLKAAGLLASGQ